MFTGSMLLQSAAAGGGDSYTKLLIHANDTPIRDESSGGAHGNASQTGSPTIDGTNKQFGAGGLALDAGGSANYIYFADHADWQLGSQDFSIDFWFKNGSGSSSGVINRGGTTGYVVYIGATTLDVYINGTSTAIFNGTSCGTYSTTQFDHFAIDRYGSTWSLYKNGSRLTQITDSQAVANNGTTLKIGEYSGQYNAFYVDELRMSVGISRYQGAASFTVPTAEYS